jgi:aspartyl/asparaginyl beta-hydroxylase (cupin superfamily)|uniref:Aspartyl/asparaginy/proline hydroxylase domain-containing protein n=1 Tax=viral metagenome TaxID=1070528 RepID=A0A6C0JGF8_9ZZZZ
MHLKELKNHWKTIREELDDLPMNVFISDKPRPTGEWEGSDVLRQIVSDYHSGKCGWLKGGQTHLQEEWISWPIIWESKIVLGNCLKCPETYKLLSKIPGVRIAGFALMKGGVKLEEHVDHVGDDYKFTYHLGLKCPDDCYLHHSELGDIKEEDGKHIIMSSRFPHWAENGSDEDRIILYLEYYNSPNREC